MSLGVVQEQKFTSVELLLACEKLYKTQLGCQGEKRRMKYLYLKERGPPGAQLMQEKEQGMEINWILYEMGFFKS